MTLVNRDYIHLHFIILIWGFTAILGKLITIPTVEMVFYRTLFAAVGIAAFSVVRRKKLKLDFNSTISLLLIGGLVAIHWILFFLSARIANVSVSLVGVATTAFWTSLLEPLMTKRKFIIIEVLLGLFVIGGLYIIFFYEFTVAFGLIIAVISAIVASIFTIINSNFAKKSNHYAIAFYEMTGACLAIVLFFPVYNRYFSEFDTLQLGLNSMDLLYILILALVCTVYAYTASIHIMKNLSAYAINLTVNLEPIYGILLAFIIFKEYEMLTLQFYIGALVILLSVLLYPVLNKFYIRRKIEVENIK